MKPVYYNNILPKDHCDKLEKYFAELLKNKKLEGDEYESIIVPSPSISGESSTFATVETVAPKSRSFFRPYSQTDIFSPKEVEKIIFELTQKISSVFNEEIIYSNALVRMYVNGSHLGIHTDRDALDITLSVNVGGLENWPMHISNISTEIPISREIPDHIKNEHKKDYDSYITPRNCGIACYGKIYPHWRDKLNCREDEYVLQIFYHWKIIK